MAAFADPATLDPVDHIPRTRPQRVWNSLLGEQQAGGYPADVLQPHGHPRGLTGRDPGRNDRARAAKLITRAASGERGEERQANQKGAEADHRVAAEHERGEVCYYTDAQ